MVVNGKVTRPAGGQLTLEEVAVLLGVPKRADGKYYPEDVCRAAAINIWSKCKPVRHWTTGPITLAQRQAVNFGFDFDDASGAVSNEIATLFARARADGGQWTYLRPRGAVGHGTNPGGSDEWFRLLDFENYDHRAVAPYNTEPVEHLSVKEQKRIIVHENEDAEIKLTDFPDIFDDFDIEEVYVYLLFREYTNNPATPIFVLLPEGGDPVALVDLPAITGHAVQFLTPSSVASLNNRTWEVIGVASAWNPDDGEHDEYNWVYIPGTYQTYTINDQDYMLDLKYYTNRATDFSASVDAQAGELAVRAKLQEWNEQIGSPAENVLLHLELTYMSGQYREPLYSAVIPGYNLDEGDEPGRFVIVQATGIDITDVPGNVLDNVYIRLWYEYNAEGDAYVYHRYFEFDSNAGGSSSYQQLSDIPYVSLSDLI